MFPDTDLSVMFSATEEGPFKIILCEMINEKEEQKICVQNNTLCPAADASLTPAYTKALDKEENMCPDTDPSEIFSATEEGPFKIILSEMTNEKEQKCVNNTSCLAADTSLTPECTKALVKEEQVLVKIFPDTEEVPFNNIKTDVKDAENE